MKSPLKKELKVPDIAGRHGYEVRPKGLNAHWPATAGVVCRPGIAVAFL